MLALRILVRLLQTQGPAYVARFTNSSDGFAVLRGGLTRLWNYGQIYTALFALFHDQAIGSVGLDTALCTTAFVNCAANASNSATEAARVIVACLGVGVQAMTVNPLPELLHGVEVVVDIIAQATRGTTEANATLTSPNVLAELIAGIQPVLPRLAAAGATAKTSSRLPLLTSANGYSFVQSSKPRLVGRSEGLMIDDGADPAVSKVPDVNISTPLDRALTPGDSPGAALIAVLRLLAQQVAQHITTRHQRKRSLSNLDLLVTPTTEMFVVVLRALFDASASLSLEEQVPSSWARIFHNVNANTAPGRSRSERCFSIRYCNGSHGAVP